MNQDAEIYDIKDIGVVNQGNKLAARDSQGITFWNLRQSLKNLSFGDTDLGYSTFMILKGGNHMIYSLDDLELVKIDLKRDMNIEKRVELSDSLFSMRLVGNGDALVEDEIFVDDFDNDNWDGMDDDYVFKLTYLDFNKAVNSDAKAGDTLQTAKTEGGSNGVKGVYELYQGAEETSCYNIVSNKGFSAPFVYENDQIEQHLEFYDDIEPGMKWRGKLLMGTVNGNCFFVDFHETSKGEFKKESTQLFKDGFPCGVQKAKTPKISDETLKDNFDVANNESLIQKKKEQFKTHDSKRFLEENLDIVIMVEKALSSKHEKKCFIYARKVGEKEWSKGEFNTKHKSTFYSNSYFKVHRMNNLESENKLRFYVASTIGIAIFSFNTETKEVRVRKYLKKYVSKPSLVCYSHSQKLFFIPKSNMVQVWNETLDFSTYNMDFESEILSLFVAEDDTEQRLLVYDDSNYYEIDLVKFIFRRKNKIIGPQIPTRIMPFNMNLFPRCRPFQVPFFKEEIYEISFVANLETLNLKEFPFDHLSGCFSKEDYYHHVKQFAVYYFQKLQLLNFEDTQYGPLNPLFFAIYHNDMRLLEDLLDNYPYPKQIKEYWSPLAFSFLHNYNSAVKVFCDRLYKRNYNVSFSRLDFQYLLNSPFSYCHKLMSTIPSEPTLQNFPRLLHMDQAVKVHFVQEVGHLLFAMKENERKILLKKSKKRNQKVKKLLKHPGADKQEGLTKTEVLSFQIPFKYSYKMGTPDSVRFLDTYSQSNTEEFILSEWKEVIIHKWKSHRVFHSFFALLYWLFTIITTYSVIFKRDSELMELISLGFVAFFILFEILQVVSYSAFKIKRYFEEAWNYIDWICFTMLICYYVIYQKQQTSSDVTRILGSAGLMVMYYRSFSYLRIIDSFTTLIGMINTIIQKLIIFFLILIYFFVTSGLLIMKLNPKENSILSLGNAYVWTFFGGIEGSDFESYDFAGIPIIFGTVMVTIILLNILIAFLSNLFSRLEDQQKSNNLKEKASMILDLEVIFHFFRYIMTGKVYRFKNFEKMQENFFVELMNPQKETTAVSGPF